MIFLLISAALAVTGSYQHGKGNRRTAAMFYLASFAASAALVLLTVRLPA